MPPRKKPKIPKSPQYSRITNNKYKFGAHVGMSGGVPNAVTNAVNLGANSFALFLKSPRRWISPDIGDADACKFIELCKEHNYDTRKDVLPHGSYFINLANPDDAKNEQSMECLIDDLKRCEKLNIGLYNFHPGSSLGTDHKTALRRLADNINHVIKKTEFVRVVVENMAGHGNYVCGTLNDIRDMISMIEDKSRVGICIDTCHAFAAGYDLRDEKSWIKFWKEFEEKVGFENLASMHLNDSMAPLGANRDLHQKLGWGFLGLECFRLLVNDPRFEGIPLILETPVDAKDDSPYGAEIKLLEWLIGKEKCDLEVLSKIEELQKFGEKSREEQAEKFEKKISKRKTGDISEMMNKKSKMTKK